MKRSFNEIWKIDLPENPRKYWVSGERAIRDIDLTTLPSGTSATLIRNEETGEIFLEIPYEAGLAMQRAERPKRAPAGALESAVNTLFPNFLNPVDKPQRAVGVRVYDDSYTDPTDGYIEDYYISWVDANGRQVGMAIDSELEKDQAVEFAREYARQYDVVYFPMRE